MGTHLDPLLVMIGAGGQRYDGWIATHKEHLDLGERTSFERFFGDRLAHGMVCEHVFEHLLIDEASTAAVNCLDFLHPGARLRLAVPDGRFPNAGYQRTVQVGGPGPPEHPAAGHKVVYDLSLLTSVLSSAGFDVEPLEWWDDHGEFHVRPWDPALGVIYRSSVFDHRNEAYRAGLGAPGFTSLIVDAIRPT